MVRVSAYVSIRIDRDSPIGPYLDKGHKRVHCPRVALYRAISKFIAVEDRFGGSFNDALDLIMRESRGSVNPHYIEKILEEIFADWGFILNRKMR